MIVLALVGLCGAARAGGAGSGADRLTSGGRDDGRRPSRFAAGLAGAELTSDRRRRLARRVHALCDRKRRHRRRGRGGGQGRPGPDPARLRLCRRRQAHPGRSRDHAVPHRLGLQADHLDRGDAAGRGRASSTSTPTSTSTSISRFRPYEGKPITLRNIMTHTAGFQETVRRLISDNQGDMQPLGTFVKDNQPDRIFPPGTMPAYSNYATALAGLHRRARLGPELRRLCRAAHLRAARHDASDLPPAAAGEVRAVHVAELRPGPEQAREVRVRRPRAGRQPVGERRGDGASS